VGHKLHFRHPIPHSKRLIVAYEKAESSRQIFHFIYPISWFEKAATGAFQKAFHHPVDAIPFNTDGKFFVIATIHIPG